MVLPEQVLLPPPSLKGAVAVTSVDHRRDAAVVGQLNRLRSTGGGSRDLAEELFRLAGAALSVAEISKTVP